MRLDPGTKLGPYSILAPLGAGGMGEVYRARDTRLDRTVAIKILPPDLSGDPSRKQRFEREARTISDLNHPHICVLYDVGHQDGIDYLVMECVDGETLAARLQRGPLSQDQVLKYGSQVADALDAAHRKGIIHRDLKPGNIMLAPMGAKLLDFGLAKPLGVTSEAAQSTAATPPLTEQGAIIGTVQYMSPEQLEGKELDGRSDIFSLGAVLYEMVTGRKAFEGKNQLSVASAILEKEPVSILAIKPLTAPALEHAIKRCLAKEVDERWQTARDLALELKWVAESGAQSGKFSPLNERKTRPHWLAWGVSAAMLLAISGIALLHWDKKPPPPEPVRFEIPIPAGSLTQTILSPDGRHLAYLASGPDGRNVVWIRPLNSLEPHFLPGTEGIATPMFWSPDSRFIAFQSGTKLQKINITGGPPEPICDAPFSVLGGAWNQAGTIIFGGTGNGIMRVSASGGAPTPVTTVNGRNEVHTFPSFLQDGKHFFYLKAPVNPGIYIGSLDTSPDQQSSEQILATSVMAAYAPTAQAGMGRLLFVREGSLLAQLFDERKLKLTGEPALLAPRVVVYLLSGGFSVAANGILAYQPADIGAVPSALAWFDREGKELGAAGERGSYQYFDLALSPDATRVATTRSSMKPSGNTQAIWQLDLVRGVSARFTFGPSPDASPVWSPDGNRIAYAGSRSGGTGLYQKASNGTLKEQVLLPSTPDLKVTDAWSRDGRYLLYARQDPTTNADLWVLPLAEDGMPSGAPTPFADTEFNENQGQFSPDDHWIAYASDESGRFEIYLKPFPAGSGSKTQISQSGGMQPRWRRDGKELFYLSLDGNVMAVDIGQGSIFKAGLPRSLFHVPVERRGGILDSFAWDVTPDGKRFLIDTNQAASRSVVVVLNWDAALK